MNSSHRTMSMRRQATFEWTGWLSLSARPPVLSTRVSLSGFSARCHVKPETDTGCVENDTRLKLPLNRRSRVSPGGSGAVMKYGFPSLANIKTRESYVSSYDPRNRTASWVIERLNPASLTGASNRKYCDFKEDDSVHLYHRATNTDYRGSGFDRGHLAAAANHKWSQKAMDDTFYLSNVSPQCIQLHGPLYLPREEADGKLYVRYQVLGRNHVAVPTHFFKVVILERAGGGGVELRSYILPNAPVNEKIPLEHFLVPIETIERASGLLFVPNIMKRGNSLQAITAK